ncbi:hypothetical protein [Amycolatopsis camponoti]|uniref:hypothetical protein n=1 Tax=Amycolatopsis camponoti TaxID=2606593 RepID=UPI001E43FDC9|nr:hypothetical protein [Amycolatopsis camponoti]
MPFLRGLPYARHNLVLDLAALTKHEMILWDLRVSPVIRSVTPPGPLPVEVVLR